MKIFMFSSVHIWNDTRILYREAMTLAEHHEVELHIVAPFEYREEKGVKIYGLPVWKRVSDRKRSRKILRRRIDESSADIYHFHDPELIPLGVYTRLKKKKPVIYDIHEIYKQAIMLRERIRKPYKKLYSVAYGLIESASFHFIDAAILAWPALEEFYTSRIDYVTIMNYPRISKDEAPDDMRLSVKDGIVRFVYVGSLEKFRGIPDIMKAFIKLMESYPGTKAELHIAGKLIESEEYRKEFLELADYPGITFHGFLPLKEARLLMAESDVGIVNLKEMKGKVISIPNKIFEYMVTGNAVIANDYPSWREIITKNGVGWMYDPMDLDSLVLAMRKAIESFDALRGIGRKGRRLVEKNYSWETEGSKLLGLYEKLAGTE